MTFRRSVLLILLLIMPAAVWSQPEAGGEELIEGSEQPAPPTIQVPSPLRITDWTKDVIEARSGYIHPFLGVSEYYTDNLFNTDSSEESEFYTVISPGIWVALPARRQAMLQLTTLSSAPGGLDVSRFGAAKGRRFQSYALYRADIHKYSTFSDEDRENQRAEGLLQYNFRGGLSLQLDDIHEKNEDPYGTGLSRGRQLDRFDSNLLHFQLDYPIGPRLVFRGDYSLYSLDYDSERNAFRERNDDVLSAYLFYKILPKTSAYLLYEYIDIDYDRNIVADSKEHHYYLGLEWDVTAKSTGRAMMGYGIKDFSEGDAEEKEDLIGEIRLDHRFTPKTSGYLRVTRRTNETDIPTVSNILAHRVSLGYRQRITAKIRGSADLFYERESYRGEIVPGAGERKDNYFGGGVAVGYAPLRWLSMTIGYRVVERDSNIEDFDYLDNTVFLNLAAAL